ncbi:MAG: methyltransferase domain-containing protein [Halobacteriales archaeon]|nr:methyltransferase domain-containing protein [Halobacteriales archaeon]
MPAEQELARRFFADAGPSYESVLRWATLGQDARWKRALLRELPRRGDVLDYACGTGLLTRAAADRCHGQALGVDLSASMLAQARANVRLPTVRFVQGDAESWEPPPSSFDAVLAAYLPKYVRLDRWLPRAARALRPGGVLLAYDFAYPPRPWRSAWAAWWRIAQPRLARDPAWRDVAEELPRLIRTSRWLPDMLQALPRHGFVDVRARPLTFGACVLVTARRDDRRDD